MICKPLCEEQGCVARIRGELGDPADKEDKRRHRIHAWDRRRLGGLWEVGEGRKEWLDLHGPAAVYRGDSICSGPWSTAEILTGKLVPPLMGWFGDVWTLTSYLPLIKTLMLALGPRDNPHFKTLNLITSAKCLLSCQITESQVRI